MELLIVWRSSILIIHWYEIQQAVTNDSATLKEKLTFKH